MPELEDVSLIIKTFERQTALERLVESIIDSGYGDCPVLIADDSREPYRDGILQKYGDVIDEYLVLPFNSGVSKGRNAALERVETEFFVLNDDDFVYGDMTTLETARSQLEEHSLDILGGQLAEKRKTYFCDWLPNRISDMTGLYSEYWKTGAWVADIHETSDGGVKLKAISQSAPLQPCHLALNFFIGRTRPIREEVGGWNPKLKSHGEHWEFFYRCKQAGLDIASSTEFGVYHIPKGNDIYNTFRHKNKAEMISISLNEHDFSYLEKDSGTYYAHS